jgi:hypothetical protein
VTRVQVQTDEIRGLCHQLLILNILIHSLVTERSLIKYTVERKKYVLKENPRNISEGGKSTKNTIKNPRVLGGVQGGGYK